MGDHPSAEFLLRGRSVRALYEVRRREFGSREGIELVMDDGPSVLLWNGTDWILRINAGRWSELPTRAWPPQAWEFVQGEGAGDSGADEILSVDLRFDTGGDRMEIEPGFGKTRLVMDSGDPMSRRVAGRTEERVSELSRSADAMVNPEGPRGELNRQVAAMEFVEKLTFAPTDDILEMLSTDFERRWGLPVWARNLAYRLACLQRPDDPYLLRMAASDLYLHGPDWDHQAEELNRRAARLKDESPNTEQQ